MTVTPVNRRGWPDSDEDIDARTDDNACPECDTGVVVTRDFHYPAVCSESCGWSS